MFILYADKAMLSVQAREPVTSGSANVYQACFRFSEDWEDLEKTAFFRAGDKTVLVPLDGSGVCSIPREVLEKPRERLRAGVCGTRGEDTVLPTVWADMGLILTGAAPGDGAQPSLAEQWAQALARKGDSLGYTPAGELGLYAGEDLLSAVPVAWGDGGSGVQDHRLLSGREAVEQHPITAVTGLERELSRRVSTDNALSIVDIIKIMED